MVFWRYLECKEATDQGSSADGGQWAGGEVGSLSKEGSR